MRTDDDEPSPEATRRALRDVVGHCLYGVDVNLMAVELCGSSFGWRHWSWADRSASSMPIKCGNSLCGATPDLIAVGIPDDAFKRIDGVAPSASVGMDDPDLGFSSPPFTADGCSDPPRTLVTHFIRANGHKLSAESRNCRHFYFRRLGDGIGPRTALLRLIRKQKCLFAGTSRDGSDGTRTRDLRRDRPVMAVPA
jgi:hypothetical protein